MAKKKATAAKKAVKKTSVKAAPVKKKPSAAKPAAKRTVKPAAPVKKAAKGKKPASKPLAKKVVKSAAPAKAVKKAPAKPTSPAGTKAAPKKAVQKAPAKAVTKAAPAKAPAKPVPVAKSASPAKAGKPAPAPAPPKAAPAPVVAKPAPAAKAPAPVVAPSKASPAAKAVNGVKTKAPVVAVLTGLDPLGAPVRTLKKALKERFQQEYYLRATPGSLYDLISTPSGFSEWFCDDVNVRGDEYGFVWNGEVEIAECLSTRAGELIRFHWQDDDDPGSFFELRIRIDPMTNETCLVVTDHAWPKDLEEAKALWDSQIQTLQRVLGA
ncbi:MAG TPA: START-like domain-containing protein [Flavobacteriales bacterium]